MCYTFIIVFLNLDVVKIYDCAIILYLYSKKIEKNKYLYGKIQYIV